MMADRNCVLCYCVPCDMCVRKVPCWTQEKDQIKQTTISEQISFRLTIRLSSVPSHNNNHYNTYIWGAIFKPGVVCCRTRLYFVVVTVSFSPSWWHLDKNKLHHNRDEVISHFTRFVAVNVVRCCHYCGLFIMQFIPIQLNARWIRNM